MSIQAADALMSIFGFQRVKPVQIKWECQPHDAGWLITATLGDVAWAHHITRDHFKVEHEPEWAFWSVIRGLARNVRNFEESNRAKV